jgi:hypothetical protein
LSIVIRTSRVTSGKTSTVRVFFTPFGAETTRMWRPEETGRLKMLLGPRGVPLSTI